MTSDIPSLCPDPKECWICLGQQDTLTSVCKCPGRFVHEECLSKWQIHSMGGKEEIECRFCNTILPNWQEQYKPLKDNIIKITIHVYDKRYLIALDPIKTPDLKAEFLRILYKNFQISEENVEMMFCTKFENNNISLNFTNKKKDLIEKMLYLARYNASKRASELV
jgi:septum formation topological specificity factor MinE